MQNRELKAPAKPTTQKSATVPKVCPAEFIDFYGAINATLNSIEDNPEIPDNHRKEIALKVALSFSLEMFGTTKAVPFASRILAAYRFNRSGALQRIGSQLFGDKAHLLRKEGSVVMLRGVTVVAAAIADLYYNAETYTEDDYSTAVLTAPSGCPIEHCPKKDDAEYCRPFIVTHAPADD